MNMGSEEFEVWRKEQITSLIRTGHPAAAKAFLDLGSIHWFAWQASRAALVIELPGVTYKQNPDYETDIELRIRQEMREKIEAAGVKVKS